MKGERKSREMREQVLDLRRRKHGKKTIARMLGLSRNTVKGIIKAAEAVASGKGAEASSEGWTHAVDWSAVRDQIGRKHTTIKVLHQEYAPAGVSYLRFWREMQRRFPESIIDQARIRLHYKPGERAEIDYCDGLLVVDPASGAARKTHLFCAVSAFSDYTYGEFCFTQRRDEFIASQERMNAFFGGVFRYVVIDNLKSGVHSAHIYDPDLNPVYVDFANHSGFAVLPARPVTPRDKTAVETAIGVIQRQFFAENRNRTFASLRELNESFRSYLLVLNQSVMKDYGVSRAERFAEERGSLQALPADPFEVSEYRKSKVHPDCHIQVDRNFYSVPYQLIGQAVRVRLTPRLLEVFNSDHERVAVHARLKTSKGSFSTVDAHYPEQKLAAVRFDLQLIRRDAERLGPETTALVSLLMEGSHPLRHLRRCQGILRLSKSYSSRAIEYGCHQARLFNRPRLAYITHCAKRFEVFGLRPRSIGVPERDVSSMYLQPATPTQEETEWH
jgi:transposase